MLKIDNFGVKSLEEVRQFLKDQSLHFGMKLEEGEDGELYLLDQGESPASEAAEVAQEAGEEQE
jgi:hypothetical protein